MSRYRLDVAVVDVWFRWPLRNPYDTAGSLATCVVHEIAMPSLRPDAVAPASAMRTSAGVLAAAAVSPASSRMSKIAAA